LALQTIHSKREQLVQSVLGDPGAFAALCQLAPTNTEAYLAAQTIAGMYQRDRRRRIVLSVLFGLFVLAAIALLA
jgi:hypothetical protein